MYIRPRQAMSNIEAQSRLEEHKVFMKAGLVLLTLHCKIHLVGVHQEADRGLVHSPAKIMLRANSHRSYAWEITCSIMLRK